MKAKAAAEVGFNFKHITVAAETSAQDVKEIVRKLNADEQVSGILVQLPLGDHVTPEGERLVTEAISPEKDVDGCVTHLISNFSTEFFQYVDSTPTTSAIFVLGRLFHCLRLAPLLEPFGFLNLQAYPSQDHMLWYLVEVTLLGVPWPLCCVIAMQPLPIAIVVPGTLNPL